MPELMISRGTLLNTLAVAFKVPLPGGENALKSRVKLLGTLGIPRKGRGVRNAHMQYGLSDVAEISMALALMNANMTPALAARYVKEKWTLMSSLSLSGMLRAIPGGIRDEYDLPDAGPLALIEGNVLSTLGRRDIREGVADVPLGSIELFQDVGHLSVRLAKSPSAIVLDARNFMQRNLELLLTFAPTPEDLRLMLNRLLNASNDDTEIASDLAHASKPLPDWVKDASDTLSTGNFKKPHN